MMQPAALVLCILCSTLLTQLPTSAAVSLERYVGAPKSYNWDGANTWAKDPLLTPIFKTFKAYKIPSAAIGYQMNPDPTKISYLPPTVWRKPWQAWWMAGFGGVSYKSPMRVASVSKALTDSVYAQYLSQYYSYKLWDLWVKYVGPLPTPKDPRVKLITIRHLLDHKSGFDNTKLGFDPAFAGKTVAAQISGIVKTKTLLAAPGTTYSYSNFGYMILAQLAEGITKKSYITLVRQLLPAGAPIYAASDSVPVPATGPGAAEPGIYYVQKPDGEFDVSVMKGNGNIVSNVATLSWYATQYWMGGSNRGKRFTPASTKAGVGSAWIWNGSMPGTMAVLTQWVTPKGYVAAISIIINTRVRPDDAFFKAVNDASLKLLQKKFAKY